MNRSVIATIESLEILEPTETILHFFSDSAWDIREGFYMLTDQAVILWGEEFAPAAEGLAPTVRLPLDQITSIGVNYADSSLDENSAVSVDSGGWHYEFPLSPDDGGDRSFITELEKLTGLKSSEFEPTDLLEQQVPEDGPTEITLASLIDLSTETATATPIGIDDPGIVALQCIEVTGAARSYCSLQIFRDPTSERDYDIEWRLDFVKPDRFHVSQVMWNGDLDEWVIVGEEHYQNAAEWFKTSNPQLAENFYERSRSLLVDHYLTILRTAEFVSSESYNDYLLLKYKNIDLSGDLIDTEQEGTETELRTWIDLDTHLLAKVEMITQSHTPEGEEYLNMQHVFAAYNEEIEVRPPTQFHEADAEGKFVIQYTETEIVPHHP